MRVHTLVKLLIVAILMNTTMPAGVNGQSAPPIRGPLVGKITRDVVSPAEKYFIGTTLTAGEEALRDEVTRHPTNDHLRFALGTVQFMRAVERLGQSLYKYGLTSHDLEIPLLRMKVPRRQSPELFTYANAQDMIRTFANDLGKADATLAGITDPDVRLPLHFGMLTVDIVGDKKVHEEERLWRIFQRLDNGRTSLTEEQAKKFYVNFDRGDVHWLRGYCNLLASFCDIYLAHDTRETFDCTAHLLFPNAQSPYPFLKSGRRVHRIGDDVDILDLVAMVHTLNWPVVDPQRLASAHQHLKQVVAQNRDSWRSIMSERDNEQEWLPNPTQSSVIAEGRVTEEMVHAWLQMMDEIDLLLDGKKLAPFWRGDGTYGVNVRRVFLEPRRLDVVMWVQGTAAAPYLEKGEKTDAQTWRRLPDVFSGNLIGFAVWFN
jgi:hypothetical protein